MHLRFSNIIMRLKRIGSRLLREARRISIEIWKPIWKSPGSAFVLAILAFLWGHLQGIKPKGGDINVVLECEEPRYFDDSQPGHKPVSITSLLNRYEQIFLLKSLLRLNPTAGDITSNQIALLDSQWRELINQFRGLSVDLPLTIRVQNKGESNTAITGLSAIVMANDDKGSPKATLSAGDDGLMLLKLDISIPQGNITTLKDRFAISYKTVPIEILECEFALYRNEVLKIEALNPDRLPKEMPRLALTAVSPTEAGRLVEKGKPGLSMTLMLKGLYGERLMALAPLRFGAQKQLTFDRFPIDSLLEREHEAGELAQKFRASAVLVLPLFFLGCFVSVLFVHKKSTFRWILRWFVLVAASQILLNLGAAFLEAPVLILYRRSIQKLGYS